jgi:hypothetical protein
MRGAVMTKRHGSGVSLPGTDSELRMASRPAALVGLASRPVVGALARSTG